MKRKIDGEEAEENPIINRSDYFLSCCSNSTFVRLPKSMISCFELLDIQLFMKKLQEENNSGSVF